MHALIQLSRSLLLAVALTSSIASAAESSTTSEKDPLRATLLESKENNRGVTIHANGSSINCVVSAIDDHYVVGRSNQASRVVIRLDRIDGVSAMF